MSQQDLIQEASCPAGWLRLIHYGSYYSVWLDADVPMDGVVIGSGSTIAEAIVEAQSNLGRTMVISADLMPPVAPPLPT